MITVSRRRTLVGLCLAMGGSLTVAASFNYVLTPMLDDLGLTQQEAGVALTIPAIASLLVVFLAGRLGDRRGHRTVISWMSIAFIVGSALAMIAEGLPVLVLGLLLEGIAATAIQIVVMGLLSDQFPEGKARAAAFGTFGMVSPFIWMLFPVVAGAIVGGFSWRVVAAIWVASGVLILFAARTLLPRRAEREHVGELWTPILAGLSVVLAVQTISHAGDYGWLTPVTLIGALAAVVCATVCVVLVRRLPHPTFSLAPLRMPRSRMLLGVVVIIPLLNTIFLMTLAFQYLYGLTVLQTALAMVPAQIAAIFGTRLIAAPLMHRIGVTRTASVFFVILSVVMLLSFAVKTDSPLWVPMTYVAAFNVLTVAASITVTSGVMSTAPADDSGQVAAYRGSGVALGQVLAVVVMNAAVFGIARVALEIGRAHV